MKTALSLLAGLALLGGHARAADTSEGAQLAATCASCHATDGSAKGIPAIVGQDEARIIAALTTYRANERPNHIMHAIALSLSDAELASVARYLALQGRNGSPP